MSLFTSHSAGLKPPNIHIQDFTLDNRFYLFKQSFSTISTSLLTLLLTMTSSVGCLRLFGTRVHLKAGIGPYSYWH